jgi:hypothetical protein
MKTENINIEKRIKLKKIVLSVVFVCFVLFIFEKIKLFENIKNEKNKIKYNSEGIITEIIVGEQKFLFNEKFNPLNIRGA